MLLQVCHVLLLLLHLLVALGEILHELLLLHEVALLVEVLLDPFIGILLPLLVLTERIACS